LFDVFVEDLEGLAQLLCQHPLADERHDHERGVSLPLRAAIVEDVDPASASRQQNPCAKAKT
jgi:hypothetical protein